MIEMYHPQHARMHPCAAEEQELERLHREGWVRTQAELDTPRPAVVIIDELDARVDEMIRKEEAEEKKVALRSRRAGGRMPLKFR